MRLFWIGIVYGLFLAAEVKAVSTPVQPYLARVQKPLSSLSCEKILDDLQADLSRWNWSNLSAVEISDFRKNARLLMQDSWLLRKAIHERLGLMTKPCVLKARVVFHGLRDYEDYLSELLYWDLPLTDPKSLDFQKQPVPIFNRDAYFPYFEAVPNANGTNGEKAKTKFDFHSGDLMLARGVSFVSAIITQVSDNRSHYSHVVTVRKDPQTGEGETVESYIGSGVEKFDLLFALKNENARLLVLRPKDEELAKAAAEVAVQSAEQKLPYDYAMDYEDAKAMSCVEVPVYAFRKASGGALNLPTYPAAVTIENPEFLSRMGLKSGLIRTPDDLETDPNFEMVLDWKDTRLIRDSRQKDAVLAEMVRWISELKYNFHDDMKSRIAMYGVHPLRKTFLWPLVQKVAKAPNIDKEVPRATFGIMVLVDELGEILLKEVRAREESYRHENKRPMTVQELRRSLEEYRLRDLEKFRQGEHSEIHALLRPNN